MKKGYWLGLIVALIFLVPGLVSAQMGQVSPKSKDVDWSLFGSVKVFPQYFVNIDFNDDHTGMDFLIDENGGTDERSVRVESRLGFLAKGKNWKVLSILEADFTYNKINGDRGAGDELGISDSGMTGEDYGLEKLDAQFSFADYGIPVTLATGWNNRTFDIFTGGIVYADDHPFIELKGKFGQVTWDLLYLIIEDSLDKDSSGAIFAENLDWRAYGLRIAVPVMGLNVSPFFVFSDNDTAKANAYYIGFQVYGKIAMVTPRFEFVYVTGNADDKDIGNGRGKQDYDIKAWAAFAALEFNLNPMLNPYIGGYYYSGDDDANDDDLEGFNAISNCARYAPTFGVENAIIYRYVPALGSHLYDGTPNMLGIPGTGYGSISNSGSAYFPGLISLGVGIKGKQGAFSYKTQFQYFWLDDTGALEDYMSKDLDDQFGWEFDLYVSYKFGNHFSIGNTLSIFSPGDFIEDYWGDDFDSTAYLDAIELKWSF